MTTDDFLKLSEMLDDKLSPIIKKVDGHERDIGAFKAVLGAFIWMGGALLAIIAVAQGWFTHK